MSSTRIKQINELIRQELSELFLKEMNLPPEMMLTITGVATDPDLRHCRIYVSVFPDDQDTRGMDILNRSAGRLQSMLHEKLVMKPLPKLSFHLDTTEEQAMKIEALFHQIEK